MRRFLLTVASLLVGLMTICLIVAVIIGDAGVAIGFAVLWATALLAGIALSAPFFLRPAHERVVTYWNPPTRLRFVGQVLKTISWVGWTTLRGAWFLLHRAAPSTVQPEHSAAPAPLPGTHASSASWLPDPTRRYQLRYWDGTRWTDHVSTDGAQSTDSI